MLHHHHQQQLLITKQTEDKSKTKWLQPDLNNINYLLVQKTFDDKKNIQ